MESPVKDRGATPLGHLRYLSRGKSDFEMRRTSCPVRNTFVAGNVVCKSYRLRGANAVDAY